MTGCDVPCINQWTQYYSEHGSLEDQPRSGRPRITTDEVDQSIIDLARENPFNTPRQIRSELELELSRRTVRRRLDEAGLLGRVARMEFPFTPANITERLEFAQEHQNWNDDKWTRVIFGDESYISLGPHGQVWVQRPEDAAYVSRYLVQGRYQFAPKIGVFACFSSQGPGCLRFIDDDMDERLYTDTMARFVKPYALRLFSAGAWWYLHDNAGYHTSRVSRAWFHNNGIDCIKLPSHSPDLNPIENLFRYWKSRIDDRHPHNLTELRQYCTEEWGNIPPLICSTLVDSMHDRMKCVLDAEGHRTRY